MDTRKILSMLTVCGVAALPTLAFSVDFACTPIEVLDVKTRVHVRCQESVNDGADKIWFFAVASSDEQRANRFMSTGNEAITGKRKMIFSWPAGDKSGAAYGCLAQDCRNPTAFGMR